MPSIYAGKSIIINGRKRVIMNWDEVPAKYTSQAEMGLTNMISHTPPTPRQRLEYELKEMEKRIDTIKLLLKNFDENPGLEEALNLMRKLGV